MQWEEKLQDLHWVEDNIVQFGKVGNQGEMSNSYPLKDKNQEDR